MPQMYSIACLAGTAFILNIASYFNWRTLDRHWATHLTHDFARNQKTNITASIFAYRTIFSFLSQRQLIVQKAPWHAPCYTLLFEDEAYVYILSFQYKIQTRIPPFVVCGKLRIATINAYGGLNFIPLKFTFPWNLKV